MMAGGQSKDTQQVGTFLGGWGGIVAVLLGIAVPVALSPVIGRLVSSLVRAMVSFGMTNEAAVRALYWLQFIAIGAGFAIVFLSSAKRMSLLRKGVGGWSSVLIEALIVACAVTLWLVANRAWDKYVDTFNTYENATELPAVGLMVLIIAVSVIVWRVRRRRSSANPRPS